MSHECRGRFAGQRIPYSHCAVVGRRSERFAARAERYTSHGPTVTIQVFHGFTGCHIPKMHGVFGTGCQEVSIGTEAHATNLARAIVEGLLEGLQYLARFHIPYPCRVIVRSRGQQSTVSTEDYASYWAVVVSAGWTAPDQTRRGAEH